MEHFFIVLLCWLIVSIIIIVVIRQTATNKKNATTAPSTPATSATSATSTKKTNSGSIFLKIVVVIAIILMVVIFFPSIFHGCSKKNTAEKKSVTTALSSPKVVVQGPTIMFDGYTPHTEYINYKFEIYSDKPIYLKFEGVKELLRYDGTHGFEIPANATAGNVCITSADNKPAKITIKKL